MDLRGEHRRGSATDCASNDGQLSWCALARSRLVDSTSPGIPFHVCRCAISYYMKKSPPRPVRKTGKAKTNAKAKAKPAATKAKPIKKRTGVTATTVPASRLIDQRIRDLADWRGETLARMRALILDADPDMTEEWKWMGTPVWSRHGIICTGESYKQVVKLTFARGASVPDPSRLFNSSLEGNTRRAIDIREGEQVDAGAFKALVKAAVAHNDLTKKKR